MSQIDSSFPRRPDKEPINWGKETGKAFGIMGKTVGKVISYVINILLTILLIGIITSIIVGSAFIIYVKNNIDPTLDVSMFISQQSQTSKMYYMEWTDRENNIGEPIEMEDQRLYGSKNSIWAPYSTFPSYLSKAFVAIEDKRFYEHKGVDWYRTASVTFGFLTGSSSQGASTITQQLIKNLTGDDDFRVQRKIQEILRALNIEKEYSKEQILEMYLNVIYLSQNSYGVQAAANTYFGKDVSELSLIECAALAAIPQYPTRYDPYLYPENNKKRRDEVLKKMYEQGMITSEEFNSAYNKDLELNITREAAEDVDNIRSWYADAVFEDVVNDLVEQKGYSEEVATKMMYNAGFQIITAMDPEVQAVLEEVYENDEYFPKVNDGIQPESAMVICDPYTNDVLGLVGGRGEKTLNRILNRATGTTRSPGSSIKPLAVYAPAMEAGIITYGSVYDDVPVSFNISGKGAWPKNLPMVYNGLTNINSAIERSVNTIAVRVLEDLTIDASFDFVKNKLHMDSFIDRLELSSGEVLTDRLPAALALGSMNYGVTVKEITAAYSIFQNHGIYNKSRLYYKVLDSEGNVILDNEPEYEIVISDENASIMTKMMNNVMNYGTGKSVTLRTKVDVAGKTGTAGNDYDRWFIGYTPYYVGGVWFGYDMPMVLNDFKTNPACTIWDTVMTKLHQKYIDEAANGGEPLKKFELAPGVITATVCKDSGKLMTEACTLDPRGGRGEVCYYTRQTLPTESCDVHIAVDYDVSGNGGVAGPGCDPANVKKVGLLYITDRSFPYQITVTDAQYVYRPLPDGVEPAGWWGVPFFENALAPGEYVGISYADKQYNRFCYDHFDFDNFGESDSETESGESDSMSEDTETEEDLGIDTDGESTGIETDDSSGETETGGIGILNPGDEPQKPETEETTEADTDPPEKETSREIIWSSDLFSDEDNEYEDYE